MVGQESLPHFIKSVWVTVDPRGAGLVSFEAMGAVVFSCYHEVVRQATCIRYRDIFQKRRICNCHFEGILHALSWVHKFRATSSSLRSNKKGSVLTIRTPKNIARVNALSPKFLYWNILLLFRYRWEQWGKFCILISSCTPARSWLSRSCTQRIGAVCGMISSDPSTNAFHCDFVKLPRNAFSGVRVC